MVLKYGFRGLIAPVFTPFSANYEVKVDLIPKYGEYLAKEGVKGVLVGGTTGEAVSMSVDERKAVVEVWAKTVKSTKQSLMVQVGGTALVSVIDMAKHAESLGVDALLCLPELFFKPQTVDDLVNYLIHVSKAAPRTPLLYYHYPAQTSVNLDMEAFIVAAKKKIPTFAGIKFTSSDMEMGVRCLAAAGQDTNVFLGCDMITSAAVTLGFDSAIATTVNLWPRLFSNMKLELGTKNIAGTCQAQSVLNDHIYNVKKHGDWVPTMKAAMIIVSGLDMGPPRLPLTPLTDKQIQEIKKNVLK